ncbi:MAG: hypothetical protein ABSD46_04295 [Bacteroidota bacterium]
MDTAAHTENKTGIADIAEKEKQFNWPLCYDAEQIFLDRIKAFLSHNSFAAILADRMRNETGTLLIDWIDHLVLSVQHESALRKVGFAEDLLSGPSIKGQKYFCHPEAMLPRIIIDQNVNTNESPTTLAIHVDSISDFIAAHGITAEPEGEPFTHFRRVIASAENGTNFEVVERRGYRGYEPEKPNSSTPNNMLQAQKLWKKRKRIFTDDADGFRQTHALLDRVIALVGCDLACNIIFTEERAYWEHRNRAAQIQKRRQDKLGLGWANHDHHTFRSSRANFVELIRAFEKLGFHLRERYYAGAQAGWGAQIMEQPVEGIVVFCDVDLEPEETEIDFARQALSASKKLGTIGLWVGLHGESFLEAGMHHLECRFDYRLLRKQLAAEGINTMDPFSDFPFLTQAFTEGELWPVRRERAEKLLSAGLIDEKQFNRFVEEGAIGSHLENLQRKGGFKGFNQASVSVIIRETDPRKQGYGA